MSSSVPIHGSISLLLALAMLFMVCSLSLGLLVSTLSKTQLEAVQYAFVIMLPSVLLSGFVFPRAEMPLPIYLITFGIPVTYFIEILRGIVLRGADVFDLLPWIAGLTTCGVIVLMLSVSHVPQAVGVVQRQCHTFGRLVVITYSPLSSWRQKTSRDM